MNTPSNHLLTKNYLSIKRAFLEKVISPVITTLNGSNAPIVANYKIARKIIQLHFYSSVLAASMTKAIAHHKVSLDEPADLTIRVWDSISTNTQFPAPWSNTDYFFDQETTTSKSNRDSFMGVYLNGEETLNLYDEKNNTAYFWTNNAIDLADWLSAAPFRTILHWFLSKEHLHLIHGACVGMNGKSILLTAKGGSGKSTTALSCLVAGMDYLADDYVGVASSGEITAWNLYNSIKITPDSLESFPEIKKYITLSSQGKSVVFLSEFFSDQIVASASLTAIMIPMISDHPETRIRTATKLEAMLALTPTTLFQLPLAQSNKLEELKYIISKIPCYFLELGSSRREVPEALKAFFTDLR